MTAELERTYAIVEQAIGRPLRDAEKAIDVLRLDTALEQAKDDLEQAIRAEMLRATVAWLHTGGFGTPTLNLTDAMRKPLDELHQLGVEEAGLELERLGYTVARAFDEAARDPHAGLGFAEVIATVRRSLPGIALRIEDELVSADLSAASLAAVARALLRVPGARDLASRVISTALASGFAATFEENTELVDVTDDGPGGGWERTAVLDGATCDRCAAGDGRFYPTWAEAMVEMPGGGPAADCRGGGRCRCRLVPRPRQG